MAIAVTGMAIAVTAKGVRVSGIKRQFSESLQKRYVVAKTKNRCSVWWLKPKFTAPCGG